MLFDDEEKDWEQEMQRIVEVLRSLRIKGLQNEYQLQEAIKQRFDEAGITYTKEYKLAPRNRLDFLVDGAIAVEVKQGKQKPNRTNLTEQIARYASFDVVKAVVVVVDRNVNIDREIGGKPCTALGLNKLWGIAL